MTKIALFPGSFDPLTNGHLDTIERAAKLFDQLVIAVATNTSKKALFSATEKKDLIQQAVSHIANVTVIEHTSGLTIDLAKKIGADAMIRGLRNLQDFEYETNIAAMNKTQDKEIETVFLMAAEKHRFLSSSLIKEVAFFGGDISELVPYHVNAAVKSKYTGD
ncbi:pantetheine-phosphate adenylyltransferase [Carnobacterium sp.]|uniref:pantetheine-phosphate adenylyltransferase n=1 Tax=Carnobacterium sp. TaxID=48221 RepID=UPI0028AD8B6E|nr:pantetheine-phosphate adenylyltransferase [Carnobacterium sp.]